MNEVAGMGEPLLDPLPDPCLRRIEITTYADKADVWLCICGEHHEKRLVPRAPIERLTGNRCEK